MIRRLATFCVLLAVSLPPAAAQTVTTAEEAAREASIKGAQRAERDAELKAAEERQRANQSERQRITGEINEIRADRARLNQALIDTAQRLQATETRIARLEARLTMLAINDQALRRSLEARRGLIGDVLAALQRMGRRPPPAVLIRPEDVLEAVRASILMGAVLPELRGEVEALAGDLAELVRLRGDIEKDRADVQREFGQLAGERERLAQLIEARRERESIAVRAAEAERARAQAIEREVGTLRELVERLDREVTQATRLAEEARRAAEAQTQATRERMAALAFRDPARLTPQAAFQDLRGRLPLPVAGSQLRAFGAPDGFGGQARGVSYATRPGAIVSAPSDGWVAFAGPFRSFGQMVILQMGGGYHVLLAGMERTDVVRGQFVLAGEPIGVLGQRQEGSIVALGDGAGQPILYVEFRREGQSIDPGPWWASTQGDRVRG